MNRKGQNELSILLDNERDKLEAPIDLFPDRMPIERFRKIWNDDTIQYSDEQLYKIREWLYAMCNAALTVAEKHPGATAKIIGIKVRDNGGNEINISHNGNYRKAS